MSRAEIERMRKALIACRESVRLDVVQMTRNAMQGGWSSADFEAAKRKEALLQTIDAAMAAKEPR